MAMAFCVVMKKQKKQSKPHGWRNITMQPFVCGWVRILAIFLLSNFSSFYVASQTIPPITTPSVTPPTPPLKPKETSRDKIIIISSVSAAFFALVFFMALLKFLRIFKLRSKPHRVANKDLENGSEKSKICEEIAKKDEDGIVKKFSWVEIERLTQNFSQVIGSGGFSTVCLGRLSFSTSSSVFGAFKVLNQNLKQELDILLHIHHDNIVKLLGYCDDEEKSVLVFEYVSNGTLQEKLHGIENGSGVSWKTRMAIAYQLASAIEYLHERCTPHIVHGDIKASNILLDDNFNCKLCDFGSAKMGFSAAISPSYPSRKQLMTGSPGYMDPFYFRTGITSKKNDIYSFGVILLELITGMEAFCSEKNQMLTSVASQILGTREGSGSTHVAGMVDPGLGGEFNLEEAKVMASISAACLHNSPSLRPSAADILQTIEDKICSVSFSSHDFVKF